jgi:hypothetical protein
MKQAEDNKTIDMFENPVRTKSSIYWRDILSQDEINGRWVVETREGTLVADPAPVGSDDSDTFTAPNGKRYWDTTANSSWTTK